MKHFFKAKTWLIVLLMYAMAMALSILIVDRQPGAELKIAQAGTEHNVSGYAWSSNFGWVSFNCTNDNSCGAVNYGINIDPSSGDFSGYAWSPNFGWLSFNRNDTGAPPDQPYKNGTILANYNKGNGQVDGWAKILSLGDDGWLKLRKFSADSGADYGVSINQSSGDFSGWAWNGNSVSGAGLGWLSFNCADGGAGGCANSNYKVNFTASNQAPEARNLTAPNWDFSQAGQLGALKANLRWQFYDADTDDRESAYQVIVDDDSNPANPLVHTGKCLGRQNPASGCLIDAGVGSYPLHDQINLAYNQSYYWWVKVWDSRDSSSAQTQYNDSNDVDGNGDPLTFTSYKHEMPLANFTYFPLNPSRGEPVKFTNNSKVYLSSAPNTVVDCLNNLCAYLWSATAGASINDPATTSPIIIFNAVGNSAVSLKVTDNDGYYVSTSTIINVKVKLPNWKEVKPK